MSIPKGDNHMTMPRRGQSHDNAKGRQSHVNPKGDNHMTMPRGGQLHGNSNRCKSDLNSKSSVCVIHKCILYTTNHSSRHPFQRGSTQQ
jgi:hypothetical protein